MDGIAKARQDQIRLISYPRYPATMRRRQRSRALCKNSRPHFFN